MKRMQKWMLRLSAVIFTAVVIGMSWCGYGELKIQLQTPVQALSSFTPAELDDSWLEADVYPSSDYNFIYMIRQNYNYMDICKYDPANHKIVWSDDIYSLNYCVVNDKIYVSNLYRTIGINVYNLNSKPSSQTERSITLSNAMGYSGREESCTFGVDSQERIYAVGADKKTIYLFDKNGKLLSTVKAKDDIYSFIGFDSSNGNFYVSGRYAKNDQYAGVVRMGNVTGNKLSFNNGYIDTESLDMYSPKRMRQSEIVNHYLCIDNGISPGFDTDLFSSDLVFYDLKKLSVGNNFNQELKLNNTSGSIATSNVSRSFVLQRRNITNGHDYYSFDDLSSCGSRCVYMKKYNTYIVCRDSYDIAEYDNNFKEIGTLSTKYPIYSIVPYKNGVIAFEKEPEGYWDYHFYAEYLPCTHSSKITLKSSASSVPVGKTAAISVTKDGTVDSSLTWKSSSPKTAYVDKDGNVTALRIGSATITAENKLGVKGSCQITVTANSSLKNALPYEVTSKGKECWNASYNNYGRWSSVVRSYIQENSDSTISRVEPNGDNVMIETYKNNGAVLVSTKSVKQELSKFGGFFSGKNHNYLVFGQDNMNEDNNREVLRIVKYDKSWKRIASVSVKGANTYIPFDAGSLRMSENSTTLYIHTCHEMYKSGDGLHHQANMTFAVDKNSMKLKQSSSGISNISTGYVSHSFNQFVKADENFLYRVDHGDAYPRGISLTKCNADVSISDAKSTMPVIFKDGEIGDNTTGACVGGFELSKNTCLIVGNCYNIESAKPDMYSKRNIFVSVTDKELKKSNLIWFTKYNDNSSVSVGNPQLVKINDCVFLVMWEETDSSYNVKTKLVLIDSYGNKISDTFGSKIRLSDCQPVLFRDGLVRWYASGSSSPVFYNVNPFALEQVAIQVPVQSVTLNKTDIWLGQNETFRLYATIKPSDATYKDIAWTSGNSNVVSVANGQLTAKSIGTATITAKTVNGKSVSCKVTVKPPASAVTLEKTSLLMGQGETFKLLTHVPGSTASLTRNFTTSNPNICTVSDNGTVTAKNPGNAVITVKTYNGKSAQCRVTVKKPATKITLDAGSFNLGLGEKTKLYTHVPGDSACLNRTYTSSNSNIVSIDSTGMMTAKKLGTVTVTAKTYNNKSVSCTVTVKNAPNRISLSKKDIWLGVGETFTLNVSLPNGTAAFQRSFTSSNSSVCSVDANGKLTAKKIGTASVTVKTFNGKTAVCNITVKQPAVNITLDTYSVNMKKGDTFKLYTHVPGNSASNTRAFSTSNSNVCTVDKSGLITAKNPGTATITVKTFNNKFASCKVTVK